MKTNEDYIEEFKKKTDPDNYEEGSYHSLKDNGESLMDTSWFPESPYELDREKIVDWLRTTLEAKDKECEERLKEEREKAVEAEKNRILDELWRLVEWHSEEKNQMFGVVSANTTINALHQARGIVRGDNYAVTSQPAPTKTDKQPEV